MARPLQNGWGMIDRVGASVIAALASIGATSLFGLRALREAVLPPYEFGEIARHIFDIGWRSLPLIATSGLAIGVVLSMHTRASLERFGAEAS
jgi:phospholipid/cholesterol/gamma-HCH transport system permease protein